MKILKIVKPHRVKYFLSLAFGILKRLSFVQKSDTTENIYTVQMRLSTVATASMTKTEKSFSVTAVERTKMKILLNGKPSPVSNIFLALAFGILKRLSFVQKSDTTENIYTVQMRLPTVAAALVTKTEKSFSVTAAERTKMKILKMVKPHPNQIFFWH